MPISRSPKRSTKPPPAPPARSRFVRPFILFVALTVLTVIVIAMPASMVKRFLPPAVGAEDFSGTLWHGSAGKITSNARNLGAIEWQVHPWALLRLTLSVDLHWVKGGFVVDGAADVTRHDLTLRDVQGGGPIEDLGDVGIAQGWHGTTAFKFSRLKLAFANGAADLGAATLVSAVGDLTVSDLVSPQIADGAALGGYALHVADAAIIPGADASAQLSDTGGPLEVQATIHLSADGHTGMLSGTVKERPDAPPALHSQIDNLAQMHARDAQGRIPVELEFTL
jgi:type II secretion system (T2SS) protein N